MRPPPPPTPDPTAGQVWRWRRNLVIFAAHRLGFSQRVLADVFDLPRSRVSAILKEIAAYGEEQARRGPHPMPSFAPNPRGRRPRTPRL